MADLKTKPAAESVPSRKSALAIYVMAGFDRYAEIMGRLGRYKTGKSCLYIKRLADIDLDVLKKLVDESVHQLSKRHGVVS